MLRMTELAVVGSSPSKGINCDIISYQFSCDADNKKQGHREMFGLSQRNFHECSFAATMTNFDEAKGVSREKATQCPMFKRRPPLGSINPSCRIGRDRKEITLDRPLCRPKKAARPDALRKRDMLVLQRCSSPVKWGGQPRRIKSCHTKTEIYIGYNNCLA